MVVMGVCGVGKTQVAKGLQERAGVAVYLEGDTFHSEENKEKMRKRESSYELRYMQIKGLFLTIAKKIISHSPDGRGSRAMDGVHPV